MESSTAADGRPRPTPRSRRSSGRTAEADFSHRSVLGEPRPLVAVAIARSPLEKDAPPAAQTRPLWWGDEEGRNKMPLRGKVVITCAVTGSIHTPTMSPYLPLTPDEIARDAIAAAEAGAAI